jgi:galactose mutarotase-like enzyme
MIHPTFPSQINPQSFVEENYYEVDGVLTTKLDHVDVTMMKKVLPKCPEESAVVGKGGAHYLKHGAFCLETQKFPDAVHHVRTLVC